MLFNANAYHYYYYWNIYVATAHMPLPRPQTLAISFLVYIGGGGCDITAVACFACLLPHKKTKLLTLE